MRVFARQIEQRAQRNGSALASRRAGVSLINFAPDASEPRPAYSREILLCGSPFDLREC
jgi:hypothetical protein